MGKNGQQGGKLAVQSVSQALPGISDLAWKAAREQWGGHAVLLAFDTAEVGGDGDVRMFQASGPGLS